MRQYWNDEPIRIVMYFDNGMTYETQTHSLSNNSIVSFVKRESEQTNFTNLFGSVTSTEISIKLFDVLDRLNIQNTASPYYKYMGQGVEIKTYISYDNGTEWENYGTYYVSSWSGSFNNGFQDIVQIDAVDEMRYILNNDLPELTTYSGIKAGKLIEDVLTGCGVESTRIKISEDLDTSMLFGADENTKVGYFLNEICQALCAIITIDNDNNIIIQPALKGYGVEYELSCKYIENIESLTNNRNMYTRVKCIYNERKGKANGSLLYDSMLLDSDANYVNTLRFSKKALNIREIAVEIDNNLMFGGFISYPYGMDAFIATNSNGEDINLTVSGEYATTVERYVISDIDYTDVKSKRVVSYEMFNKYIDNKADAKKLSDAMASYIKASNRKIRLKTIYTPKITKGDILSFTDSELLLGKYKVVDNNVIHGEGYEKILTLIPYVET